jgi:glutamate-1-semialdehyde 2,1-aminomutase
MTGFRVSYGGAQSFFDISPDITCLGKIIGGGLPVGAYGGKKDIMAQMAPNGPIYQAGTLSGNPVAMAAGIATLQQISLPGFYENLDRKADRLVTGLRKVIQKSGIPATVERVGSMMGLFFTGNMVRNFDDAKTSDLNRFSIYYTGMREKGIYIAPSQFEALFLSAAHENEHIDATIAAVEQVISDF